MKLIISLFFVTFLSQATHAAIQLDKTNLNAQSAQQLESFVSRVETKLPKTMREKLSTQTITVQFAKLDNETKIVLPNCANTVDSIVEATAVKAKYKNAQGKLEGVRYNEQLESVTSKNKVSLNVNFVDVIVAGEAKAQSYNCDHRNTYRLAEASLINGLARIYDGKGKDRLTESLQYKYTAGWNQKKLMSAFWPRALNIYEYAGTTADHFANNVEFFVLDSEYACRRPLMQEYLVKNLGNDPFNGKRDCEVNTQITLPSEITLKNKDAATGKEEEIQKASLKTYDINPAKVHNVYYMKASAGGGFGFGHSMFRIAVCPPNMSISKECDKYESGDLVFNPRARANEMTMDNMKGFFGGYPSQFLVNSVQELSMEYGNNSLRHLFYMPLGHTENGQFVETMREDQKKRFIYAALESYWAYYGNYKFVSNNCADEAMRLYQMSSTDQNVLSLGVLKPNDINKKLSKLGLIDDSRVKQFEKNPSIIGRIFGRGKIKSQKEYDERRALIEEARYENAYVSRVFQIEDAVRAIMAMEGNPNPDFKTAKKEIKKWLALATPEYKFDEDEQQAGVPELTDDQKQVVLQDTFDQIRARYEALMARAQTQEQKNVVVFYFHRIMFHVYNKRADQVGDRAVQLA